VRSPAPTKATYVTRRHHCPRHGDGGAVALLYFLIDILLILFLGIAAAAALQPGHVGFALGGAKGLAIPLIYLVLVSLVPIAVLVGPVPSNNSPLDGQCP
jgi:hypothetical protein